MSTYIKAKTSSLGDIKLDAEPTSTHNLVIYSLYVRNQTAEGTFKAAAGDLGRIKALNVDYVWLLPIHPIGVVDKKGSLGCPYAIKDYKAVNPEYGSLEDFKEFVKTAHDLGLKVMIDVVYNHTSPDSPCTSNHTDWYRLDDEGKPTRSNPRWSDIVEFSWSDKNGNWIINDELCSYLIDALVHWTNIGVDGFRCDVAGNIPLTFWKDAKKAVSKVNPKVIWLAESAAPVIIEKRRTLGYPNVTTPELFTVFDLCYDYELFALFIHAVCTNDNNENLKTFLMLQRYQPTMYPASASVMHFVENHDTPRFNSVVSQDNIARAWTAFQAFLPGAMLLHGGQESNATKTPSLFEKDSIPWRSYGTSDFLSRICLVKKHKACGGFFNVISEKPHIVAQWRCKTDKKSGLLGIFNVTGKSSVKPKIPLSDGQYLDLISGQQINVASRTCRVTGPAMVLEYLDKMIFDRLSNTIMDRRRRSNNDSTKKGRGRGGRQKGRRGRLQ